MADEPKRKRLSDVNWPSVAEALAIAFILFVCGWAYDINTNVSKISYDVTAILSITEQVQDLSKRVQLIENTRYTAEDAREVQEELKKLKEEVSALNSRLLLLDQRLTTASENRQRHTGDDR